ncbi:MAG TPA: penicillin-binding protein, partial [bacterium]
MAIKLKFPKKKKNGKTGGRFFSHDPVIRVAVSIFVVLAIAISGVFSYYYVKYDRIISRRFKGQVFSNSAKIYGIPTRLYLGEKIEPREIAAQLRQAGYAERNGKSAIGNYRLLTSGVEIEPGPESYHS